jgi:hypothetical protein
MNVASCRSLFTNTIEGLLNLRNPLRATKLPDEPAAPNPPSDGAHSPSDASRKSRDRAQMPVAPPRKYLTKTIPRHLGHSDSQPVLVNVSDVSGWVVVVGLTGLENTAW